jgi:hypothetical protein
VVYAVVGVIALRIAFGGGHGGGQADRQGALHQLAAEPFGGVLLWALVVGFACMTLWRASNAIWARGDESGAGHRIGSAARAVFYASVCWGTLAYAAGFGSPSSSDAKSRDWTARALGLPGGRWLVGVAGVGLAVIGVVLAVRGVKRTFLRKLETGRMGRRTRQVVTVLGVSGQCARGAVAVGAGIFAVVAAVRFDPDKAKGMDDTLRSFAHTPAGPWLLVLVALGLLLFAGFSFASARWRRV